MSEIRLGFYLSDFEKKIIAKNMQDLGLNFDEDFDKYFQKTVTYRIEESGFKNCDTFHCKVKKNQLRNPLTKKKMDFIQCLANTNNTTMSSAISVLLLLGYPTKRQIEMDNLFEAIKLDDKKSMDLIIENIKKNIC